MTVMLAGHDLSRPAVRLVLRVLRGDADDARTQVVRTLEIRSTNDHPEHLHLETDLIVTVARFNTIFTFVCSSTHDHHGHMVLLFIASV